MDTLFPSYVYFVYGVISLLILTLVTVLVFRIRNRKRSRSAANLTDMSEQFRATHKPD